ncbi:S8 family peptidase [Paenibacillus contaminans]|uniref:Peptidase S8 n=1 Tax=Paenibacillus contaminans TaxID=450362 RepID=A0A329MQ85_9BACL|nr:S8 family peptidase [Paenibacillus contaminans]RAV21742.1 peptidase S8 [Paenibacillus contaminans]
MRKYVGAVLISAALIALLIPRNETPDLPEKPEALSADKEMSIKQALVDQDMKDTDMLCRSQCALDLHAAAERLPTDDEAQIRSSLTALQQEHPHMKKLIWYGAGEPLDKGIHVGEAPEHVMYQAAGELQHAKETAQAGRDYESPTIQANGETYFVIGVPSANRNGSLVGVVHQEILRSVHNHQIKNLRVVPYPADNNWKIESVDSKTLQDVDVNHPEDNEGTSHYHKFEVVVKFKQSPSEADLQKIRADIQAQSVRKLGYTYIFRSSAMEAKQLMDYFHKWGVEYSEPHFLYMTNTKANWDDGSGSHDYNNDNVKMRANNGTEAAEEAAAPKPNDVLYSKYQWNLPIIATEPGWTIGKGNKDVIVAVVDTGVDLDHPDLKGRLLEGHNVINNDASPQDDVGHGTHVAGVISALTDNREGVAGMTWYNPVLPVKVLDETGAGSTYAVAQGIIWAADHGAKVINMSLGNYADANFLHDAIKYAYDKDVVLIAASGNDNTEKPGYPAAYPEVLAVAAIDSKKSKASFSNYGEYIDVAAPGVSIASTYPKNQYAALSGTSMASPHVTALAALIRSVNPLLKNTEVMDIMRQTATDLGPEGKDNYFGHGQIDVVKALKAAEQSRGSLGFWYQWMNREWKQAEAKAALGK